MSQDFIELGDKRTHTKYDHIKQERKSWTFIRSKTPLSYKKSTFQELLRFGNLNYREKINSLINEFRTYEIEKQHYYEDMGKPILDDSLYTLAEDFLHNIYSHLIRNEIFLPLFMVSYFEKSTASIDLSLDRPSYNVLINISKDKIIFTILDKNNPNKVRKGSDSSSEIYQYRYYNDLCQILKGFEKR